MLEKTRPEIKAVIDNITNVFASDMITYVAFLQLVEVLDIQATSGDKSSQILLDIIINFNKLLLVSKNGLPNA